MRRLALFLIGVATPRLDREYVLGDTIEQFEYLEQSQGLAAARLWLWREALRVLRDAPRHRSAIRAPSISAATRGDGPMSAIWQDVHYALRLLRRSPGFATVAVATLALGIGANAAMFAVVNAVLLKPLPFKDADRLMLVHLLVPHRENAGVVRELVWSYPKYRTFVDKQQVFDDTALFASRELTLTDPDNPQRVRGEIVTERYPAVLGVTPVLGRPFTASEANSGGLPPAAVVSYGLWTRRFAADPAVLGRTLRINATAYTIVGVFPAGFRGLTGNADVWIPLGTYEPVFLTQRYAHGYSLIARRKAGVTEGEATATVRGIGQQIDAEYRDQARDALAWGASATSLYASRVDVDVRRAMFVLLAAVGFVLLIACVNLTNLLMARAVMRRREMAVRIAVGAGGGRIARQFLVESLVLAGFGAAGGLLTARMLLGGAAALLPESDVFFRTPVAQGVPRIPGAAGLTRIGADMIGLDAATLVFTCAVMIFTAVLVALVPALQASRLRPSETLKTAGTARGFSAVGPRAALVSAQIALALVLLAGAGLMVKSVARLQRTGAGVAPERLVTARINLPPAVYDNQAAVAFFQQLAERLRMLGGIDSVGLANCAPVSGGCSGTVLGFERGRHASRGSDAPSVGIHWASAEYFETLGIKLRRGRLFTGYDRIGQPKVAIVNETAARRLWPNADPIGKSITLGQGGFEDGAQIIGVVADVRYQTIEADAIPDVYIPLLQSPQRTMRLFVRSGLDLHQLVAAIRGEVRTLDRSLPLMEVKTMEERLGDAMWRTRLGAWLLSAFGGLALLLTAIGIFGVMAQMVAQRTRELGIRMALGAQTRDVLALVLGRAALVTGTGLVVGIACALALTRLMAALLYDVRSTDPATFTLVALLLGVVALAACYLPARRATRVDAVVALRSE